MPRLQFLARGCARREWWQPDGTSGPGPGSLRLPASMRRATGPFCNGRGNQQSRGDRAWPPAQQRRHPCHGTAVRAPAAIAFVRLCRSQPPPAAAHLPRSGGAGGAELLGLDAGLWRQRLVPGGPRPTLLHGRPGLGQPGADSQAPSHPLQRHQSPRYFGMNGMRLHDLATEGSPSNDRATSTRGSLPARS